MWSLNADWSLAAPCAQCIQHRQVMHVRKYSMAVRTDQITGFLISVEAFLT